MPKRRKNRKTDFISAYRQEQAFRRLEKSPDNLDLFKNMVEDYNNMIKYANSRMRAIEKNNLDYYSDYNSAKNALGIYGYSHFPRFSINRADEDYEEFKILSRQARRFVTSKLGTVGEIKQHEKSVVEFWSNFYYETSVERNRPSKSAVKQAITELSRNGLLKDSEMFYDSDIIGEAIDFIASGKGTARDVKNRITDVRKGRKTYANIFN